jgi:hypothetical protein
MVPPGMRTVSSVAPRRNSSSTLFAANVIGAKTRVAGQGGKLEHLLVEARRPVEIVDIEAGLDHAVELWHRATTY